MFHFKLALEEVPVQHDCLTVYWPNVGKSVVNFEVTNMPMCLLLFPSFLYICRSSYSCNNSQKLHIIDQGAKTKLKPSG